MPQIKFQINDADDLAIKRNDEQIEFIKINSDSGESLVPLRIADPTNYDQALSLGYFNEKFDDKLVELLSQYVFLDPVKVHSSSNQDLLEITISIGDPLVFEGTVVEEGDRILLIGQDDKIENGIYSIVVTSTVDDGEGGTLPEKFKLTRSNKSGEAVGDHIQRFHVKSETDDIFFVVSSDEFGESYPIGVSPIEFKEFHVVNTGASNGLKHGNNINQLEIDDSYLIFSDNDGAKELAVSATKLIVQELEDGTGGLIDAKTIDVDNLTTIEFSISSDRNIKNSIHSLSAEETHEKVLQLQGVKYKLNKDNNDQEHIGFIAQDVEEVFPEFVKQGDVKSVNYSQMVAVLLESIKHQNSIIQSLEARIKALE